MAFKNLCGNRRELDPDVLRQRRDVFALGLGLIIYNIAGGSLTKAAEFAAVHITFIHPNRLYVIAILGLFYFTSRYWVVAPRWREPFMEEVDEQWRVTSSYRALTRHFIEQYANVELRARALDLASQGWSIDFMNALHGQPLSSLSLKKPGDGRREAVASKDKRWNAELGRKQLWSLRLARTYAYIRAILFERTFTDLMLPYVVAYAAILVCAYAHFWKIP